MSGDAYFGAVMFAEYVTPPARMVDISWFEFETPASGAVGVLVFRYNV